MQPDGIVTFGVLPLSFVNAHHMVGDYESALSMGARVFATHRQRGEHHGQGWLAWITGLALLAVDRAEEARAQFQTSLYHFESISAESWYVTSYLGLARAELALGNVHGVRANHCQTMFWQSRHPHPYWLTYSLGNEASLCLGDNQVKRAVEIHALAERFPFVSESVWFRNVHGNRILAAADILPADPAMAVRARSASLDLWETALALADGCQPLMDCESQV